MSSPEPAFLEWRIRLFGVGAILAIFGIFAEMDWMVSVAIAALAIGLVMGLITRRRSLGREDDDDDFDDQTPASEPRDTSRS